jgi:hypothetical protein
MICQSESLAALFALLTGAWGWTLPETKGMRPAVVHGEALHPD